MGFVKMGMPTATGRCGHRPLRDFTRSPSCIRICDIVPRGRGRTPPLRPCWRIIRIRRGAFQFAALYRAGGASPSPTLRLWGGGAVTFWNNCKANRQCSPALISRLRRQLPPGEAMGFLRSAPAAGIRHVVHYSLKIPPAAIGCGRGVFYSSGSGRSTTMGVWCTAGRKVFRMSLVAMASVDVLMQGWQPMRSDS